MNPPTIIPSDTTPSAPARPFYWSVRRELWENRSIYIVPLVVAAFVLFGSLFSLIGLPRKMKSLPAYDPATQHAMVVKPLSLVPAPIMLMTFLVGIFYALDALYSERRDRSILFWKSLPVSDRTTVLSKASIPLAVLPLIGLLLGMLAQWFLLMLSNITLLTHGMSPAALWGEFRFIQEPLVMIYGLTVHTLWFAPIYCWLLLISAWARRTPLLWAAVPPLMIGMLEKMVFNTTYFGSLLRYRTIGAMTEAFVAEPKSSAGHGILDQVTQLDPLRFLTAPGLWLGLMFAAACLAAAIRLRRNREPI
jgi:ABC-2 type transport system permease protein